MSNNLIFHRGLSPKQHQHFTHLLSSLHNINSRRVAHSLLPPSSLLFLFFFLFISQNKNFHQTHRYHSETPLECFVLFQILSILCSEVQENRQSKIVLRERKVENSPCLPQMILLLLSSTKRWQDIRISSTSMQKTVSSFFP